jgi:hypothetical protein
VNLAADINVLPFSSPKNPIHQIIAEAGKLHEHSPQANYIVNYLLHLEANVVIVEQNYFDRDYLNEFSKFYSKSSKGYPNICKRVHFFSSNNITKNQLKLALGNDSSAIQDIQNNYLGFCVIRPIPAAPLGRTVLKWYEDREELETPRVIQPARYYKSHIANIELTVRGLAWQQQDSAVAACATIGIWSMLHSSALSEHNAIPTTSEITEAAHKSDIVGTNTFPSKGLTVIQILQSIRHMGLSPIIVQGSNERFTKKDFVSISASFIRSGYPLLLVGRYAHTTNGIGHAICAVGFRDSLTNNANASQIYLNDESVDFFYVHDDNIGPNVRMEAITRNLKGPANQDIELCSLKMTAPDYIQSDNENLEFIPSYIIAAVHTDLRICPLFFQESGKKTTETLHRVLNELRSKNSLPKISMLFSTRFINLHDYLDKELDSTLGDAKLLAKTRLSLLEKLPPMSLHLAVLRIGTDNMVLLEILYDTTDSDRNRPVFGHIVYDRQIQVVLDLYRNELGNEWFEKHFGPQVSAF